ncbi:hypothetical protein PM082_024109 [Marasmius tenuissimus]|nr:hypothetical protein PM082_024109 [Marasmius tenuissimus]
MAFAFHGHLHTSSVDSLDMTRARLGYHLKAQSYDSLPNDNFTNSNLSISDLSTRDSLELSRVRLGYPHIPEFEFQTPKRRNREAFIHRQSSPHTNLEDRLNTFEDWTEIIHSMEGQRSELETRRIARSQKPVVGRRRTEAVEANLSFPLVLMDHTECMGCTDLIPKSLSVETACSHVYCYTCVENLISQSLAGQESNFPPRCCPDSTPIALDRIENRIDAQLISRIRDKTEEYSIPLAKRVYCPNGGCSVFLGSRKALRRKNKTSKPTPTSSSVRTLGFGMRATPCPSCSTQICLRCYQNLDIHPFLSDRGSKRKWRSWKPSPCSLPLPRTTERKVRRQSSGTFQLRLLAAKEKWQKCPGCARLVERNEGCYHMTCRCGTNFCYKCGGLWNKRSWCHYYVVGRPWPGVGMLKKLLG